jgi:hypothetical protein
MRLLLIASLILSPLAFTTGCASDDVVRRDTRTRTTYGDDGERKVTKTEKTVRVDDDVNDD